MKEGPNLRPGTRFTSVRSARPSTGIKQQHFALWNAVAVWKVESRYNVVGTIQKADAESMISAAEQLLKAL